MTIIMLLFILRVSLDQAQLCSKVYQPRSNSFFPFLLSLFWRYYILSFRYIVSMTTLSNERFIRWWRSYLREIDKLNVKGLKHLNISTTCNVANELLHRRKCYLNAGVSTHVHTCTHTDLFTQNTTDLHIESHAYTPYRQASAINFVSG